MSDLNALVEQHRTHFPGKALFTAFNAAVPIYRIRTLLLVREAVELDPIDLFLLRGVSKGLNSPQKLSLFFGLDKDIVEDSVASMLHNEWVSSHPTPSEDLELRLEQSGRDVLSQEQAVLEQTRETEIWVDGLTGRCEVKRPKAQLHRPRDVKDRGLVPLKAQVPQPKLTSDLNLAELEKSLSQLGSQIWPGTRLATLLDILKVEPRRTGYKDVQILVFNADHDDSVEFLVFDTGTQNDRYERILKRLELEENVPVVPGEPLPSDKELAAYSAELDKVKQLARTEAELLPVSSASLEPKAAPSTVPLPSDLVDDAGTGTQEVELEEGDIQLAKVEADSAAQGPTTTQFLRAELAETRAQLDSLQQIVDGQAVVRNQDNRIFLKRVLLGQALSYLVMEFPWITRGALDDEMFTCFEAALKRRVKLWIAWGLDDNGQNPRSTDESVLKRLETLGNKYGKGMVNIQYRGNTHRKVLVWDGSGALVTSFNFGSFRGDPKRGIREELGVIIRSPREISILVEEYKTEVFGVEALR